MHQSRNRVVAVLGDFFHEGIKSSVSARGFALNRYRLFGLTPKTWNARAAAIQKLRQQGALYGVIIYLPTPVFLQACEPSYRESWERLLAECEQTRTIIFAFSDNLQVDFQPRNFQTGEPFSEEAIKQRIEELNADDAEWPARKWEFTLERMKKASELGSGIDGFLKHLFSADVEIAPFFQRDDVTIRIEQFLEELDGQIFLRLYVPRNRYQAEQIDSFLKVFERYLRQVERREFSIETRKAQNGVVYIFRGTGGDVFLETIEDAFARFDDFMKFCRDDAKKASEILNSSGVAKTESPFLVAKYAKEYQRIVIDAKHEFEHKALLLAQRLERDILEIGTDGLTPSLTTSGPSVILNLTGNTGAVTLNLRDIGNLSASSVATTVGDVMNAGLVYSPEETKLLELFQEHASRLEAIHLKSDLDQAKDPALPQPMKMTAKQRIMGFLFKVGGKAGDIAVTESLKALAEYVKTSFGIG